MSKRWSLALASAMITLSVAACGSPGQPGAPAAGDGTGAPPVAAGAPYKVGLVYSKSGPLASYGAQYRQGLTVGLDYATKGTGAVNGHPIEVTEADDAGDPAKAVTAGDRPHRRRATDHRRLDRLAASPCRSRRWPRTTRSSSSPGRPRPTP